MYVHTQIFSFRQYTFQYQNESCVRDFLFLFSVLVREKATINENVSITDHVSGMQLPYYSKLPINQKNDNNITICWHDVIVHYCFSLVSFSYLSKLHVNIITGSGVMAIFIYKGLTRNQEIRYTPIRVLPNI